MTDSAIQSSRSSSLVPLQQSQEVVPNLQSQNINSLQLIQQQAFQTAQAGLIYPDWESEDKSLRERLWTILTKLDEMESVTFSVQQLAEMTQLIQEQYLIVQRRKEIHAQTETLKEIKKGQSRFPLVSQFSSLPSKVPTSLAQSSHFQTTLQLQGQGVPTHSKVSPLTPIPSSSWVSPLASTMALPASSSVLALSTASAMSIANVPASSPVEVRHKGEYIEIPFSSLVQLLTAFETQFINSIGDAREMEAVDKLVDIVLSSVEPKMKAKVGNTEFEISKKYFLGEKVTNSVLVNLGVIHIAKAKLLSALSALSLPQETMAMFLAFLGKINEPALSTLSLKSTNPSASLLPSRKRDRPEESIPVELLALSGAFSPPPQLPPIQKLRFPTAVIFSPPPPPSTLSIMPSSTVATISTSPQSQSISSPVQPVPTEASLAVETPIDLLNDPIFFEEPPSLRDVDLRAVPRDFEEDDLDRGMFEELKDNDN